MQSPTCCRHVRKPDMSCVMSAPSATRFCTMSPTCQMTCPRHVGSDIACLSFLGSGQHADIRHLPTKVNGDRSVLLFVMIRTTAAGASRRGVLCFAWTASRRRHIIRRTVSLVVSFLGNPARVIAIGTLTPVVVLRICTASSTFFICAALFFDMLGNGVYSLETD